MNHPIAVPLLLILPALLFSEHSNSSRTIRAEGSPGRPRIIVQLNWLHDPTFAGEYLLAKRKDLDIVIREGGPNVTPLSEVVSGRASAAVVGADIFLKALDAEIKAGRRGTLTCFFVDFQRNPVGWVLHPTAAKKAGLPLAIQNKPKQLNAWLFQKVKSNTISIGDKRGTETTSIWMQWKQKHEVPESVKVVPVGFDASLVLSAPLLAYPVYLNEEPYKLAEKIGRDLIVFDPVDDGVAVYGNVLVSRLDFARANTSLIRQMQGALRASWEQVRKERSAAIAEVRRHYKNVSSRTVSQQVEKTVAFVFFHDAKAGEMDVTAKGRWARTLTALSESGLISHRLTVDILQQYLIPPK